MEAMGILGFIFGLAGLSFAMTARSDLAKLKQEFDEMKASLATPDDVTGNSESN